MNRFTEFYRISSPAPAREMDADARSKYYRRLRLQAFAAATLGYSLYYVCRTSLNVMKKPILDSGALDTSQLGSDRIGAPVRLCRREIRKRIHCRLLQHQTLHGHGLILSAAVNALMGLLGLAHSVIPTAVIFVTFAVMWGINGWAQSMERPRPSYPSRAGIPPGTGNLLRILLGEPQSRGILLIPIRGLHRDIRRMAGRILRIGRGGSNRCGDRHLLAP